MIKAIIDSYLLSQERKNDFKSNIEDIDLEVILEGDKIKYNEDFDGEYIKVINRFNREFSNTYFLEDGSIDWVKIVKFNSENKLKM